MSKLVDTEADLALDLAVIYLSIYLSVYYNRPQGTKLENKKIADKMIKSGWICYSDTAAQWLHNTSITCDLRYCLCRSVANTTIIHRPQQSPATVLTVSSFFNNANNVSSLLCGTCIDAVNIEQNIAKLKQL